LAVALNWGTGSSFLNALVNAFDKLHMVRKANSGYSGSKYSRWTSGKEALRSVELAANECRVEDQFRLGIADLGLAPRLDLALHRLKVPLDTIHSD
jgi:hypothetical protein